MSKVFGDWLFGLIVTLTAMGMAYGAITTWIKSRGIRKKELEELKKTTEAALAKVHEMEQKQEVTQKDVVRVDGMLQQILKWVMDRTHH